ncbi:MAG: hypothetical protein A2X84_02570 [Desulfuromonadaceae bacterium GWC2_58_13]|nr:MAG: hypothetical protein A2X84_02570 [Desulfuromonadaceae bacterium GWC2_58_13]
MIPSRRLLSVLFLVVLLVGVWACQGASEVNTVTDCTHGSGTLKTENRELPPFHALDIDGAFSVTITCQQEQELSVSADDNLLPLITTEVQNGTLRITTRKPICTSNPLTVTMSVATLESIKSGGANGFSITALNSPSLKVNLSGAGNMSVEGKTKDLAVVLEGASEIHASELRAVQVDVSISGAGSAEVFASEALNAEISGVGDIRYGGQPAKVVRNITGWGTVAPLGE